MSRVFGPVTQNGYVVDNLEDAVAYWASVLGIGPFFLVPSIKFESFLYNGVECHPEIRIALANSGDLQIELIEQINDAPSFYSSFLERFGTGLQHLSVWSTSYDDDIRRRREDGLNPIVELVMTGGVRASFYGQETRPGAVMEVLELTPEVAGLFGMIRQAAVGWDGVDILRSLR